MMLSYIFILLFLYLTPAGGYYLAKQCGKEPIQGKKLFQILSYLLLFISTAWLGYNLHPAIILIAAVLYIPLYFKRKPSAGPSLAGFLYGMAVIPSLQYELGVLLFLYGIVEGTLYSLPPKKKWTGLLGGYLLFLVLGVLTAVFLSLY